MKSNNRRPVFLDRGLSIINLWRNNQYMRRLNLKTSVWTYRDAKQLPKLVIETSDDMIAEVMPLYRPNHPLLKEIEVEARERALNAAVLGAATDLLDLVKEGVVSEEFEVLGDDWMNRASNVFEKINVNSGELAKALISALKEHYAEQLRLDAGRCNCGAKETQQDRPDNMIGDTK